MDSINKHLFLSTHLLLFLVHSSFGSEANQEVLISQVAARVNDRTITLGEIKREVSVFSIPKDEEANYIERYMEQRIEKLLSVAAFEKKGLSLPDSYIDREYNKRLAKEFDNSREKFRNYLEVSGQTPSDYKELIKEEIIHIHMRSERKRSTDEISPKKVEDYYNQNKDSYCEDKEFSFREILFRGAGKSELLKLQSEIEKISEQLSSGQDFEKLASEFGESHYKKKGGLWNGYTFEFIPKQNVNFKNTLNSLEEGEVSSPFFDNLDKIGSPEVNDNEKFELRIIKLEDVSPSRVLPLDEVRAEIERKLAQNAESESQRKWLSLQEDDFFIERNLD